MLFSLPFFLVITALSRDSARQMARRDWLMLVAMGFIGYYLASYLDFLGLQYISAGLERLTLFLYPTIVVILSAILFKRRIQGYLTFALVLSYIGIVLVFAEAIGATGRPSGFWLGT